jgi:hypothetical protein
MIYCRIDLSKTNYIELENYKLLDEKDFDNITTIYKTYCEYKGFTSVVPIFYEEIVSPISEVIGYFDNEKLIAFSLLYLYPSLNTVCAEQFAWNYESPQLRLGYKSIENECARYKRLGYQYLYLGEHADYKEEFDGFEILGALND